MTALTSVMTIGVRAMPCAAKKAVKSVERMINGIAGKRSQTKRLTRAVTSAGWPHASSSGSTTRPSGKINTNMIATCMRSMRCSTVPTLKKFLAPKACERSEVAPKLEAMMKDWPHTLLNMEPMPTPASSSGPFSR